MEYTKEQKEELERIDAHINALKIGYDNCIKLLTKPIKLMSLEDQEEDDKERADGEEEDDKPKASSELLALKLGQLKKYYAQGVDELSKVADNLYGKITDKKKERKELIDFYSGAGVVAEEEKNVDSPPQQSLVSQRLK